MKLSTKTVFKDILYIIVILVPFCLATALLELILFEKLTRASKGFESYGEFAHAGFLITAALASICFSWLRAIEKEEHKAYVLTGCAEQFVASALLFLVASIAMYSADIYRPKDGKIHGEGVSFFLAIIGTAFEFLGILMTGIKVIALLVLLNKSRPGTHALEMFYAWYKRPSRTKPEE